MTHKPHLLIVDDELLIRDLLYDFFKNRDYDITVADSAQSALTEMSEASFDAIILDLKMPDMDGLELAEKLRAQGQDIPIIMMTGFPSMETAIEALRRHADDYFIKPFNLKQMNRAVEAALTRTGRSLPARDADTSL